MGNKETINRLFQHDIENLEEDTFSGTNKSNVTIIYEMHFLDKKTPKEIACHIPIGKRQIQNIIKTFKDKVPKTGTTKIKTDILTKHFIECLPVKELVNELKIDKSYAFDIINQHISLIRQKYLAKSL